MSSSANLTFGPNTILKAKILGLHVVFSLKYTFFKTLMRKVIVVKLNLTTTHY